ncbi:MAG: flagellin [Victivallales bacterium]|nr:flagellin [Victivallales bacterium]
MRINNNTAAFNVWSNYTTNLSKMQASMSKLSTGEIATTDDPAGVGISERMRAQIDSVSMARQNTDNAISMLQTADSWLQKINDQVSRMKELSVESQSGTVSDTDKENIQVEFKAMQDEITRITSKYTAAAKFNGIYLFRGGDGSADTDGDKVGTGEIAVQVGADVNQKITISLNDLQVTNTQSIGSVHTYSYGDGTTVLGSSHDSVTWSSIIDSSKMSIGDDGVSGKLDVAIDFIANARASMGAQQNRIEQTNSGLLAYEDNLTAAESQIRDIDMAKETTEFSKYQVLTSASNAMLAQANQLPQNVLQLLG